MACNRTHAIAPRPGGLEGCNPSKKPLFPTRLRDTQRVPGRAVGWEMKEIGEAPRGYPASPNPSTA
jgi:hypothetical protein